MEQEVVVKTHRADKRGNVFTLQKSIGYFASLIKVPKGFESDGASVPRFFWRLVFPPTDTRALYAAIIHDYIYRKHPKRWTRWMADVLFCYLLIKGGICRWKAYLAYFGVRLFGRKPWKEGGQNDE